MVGKRPTIIWEPTAMQKHPDSIISSDFANYKPSKPEYLKEKATMKELLSMSYARMWFDEKEKYEKSLKPTSEIEYLKRKFVTRGLNTKKQHVDATCHLLNKPIDSNQNK